MNWESFISVIVSGSFCAADGPNHVGGGSRAAQLQTYHVYSYNIAKMLIQYFLYVVLVVQENV